MGSKTINITLKVWRQKNSQSKGAFETYQMFDVDTDASFLEMLDIMNQDLIKNNKSPIAFDHDCREGICGMCGAVVNGYAHGPEDQTTLCQLHMRFFNDGDVITIEPFRSRAMPVVKDLVVDRSSFDRIIAAGGYISVKTGAAQDANAIPIKKRDADLSFDAAQCIGCAACVAACGDDGVWRREAASSGDEIARADATTMRLLYTTYAQDYACLPYKSDLARNGEPELSEMEEKMRDAR